MAPDMIYRLQERPESSDDKNSKTDRIPGAPTFNQGMSICISNAEHIRVHQNLNADLNRIGQNPTFNGGVAGTARLGAIYRYVRTSVAGIKGPDLECLQNAKDELKDQTQFMPVNQPGRTQGSLPLSSSAADVLTRGYY